MNGIGAWLAARGIDVPDGPELVEAAVALGIIGLALIAGWAAARWIGPALVAMLGERAGFQGTPILPRIAPILRHLTIALMLAIANRLWPWSGLSTLLIGLVWSIAAARGVIQTLRGLRVVGGLAWAVGLFVFVAIFTRAVGGLTPVTELLDSLAVQVGSRRISLLDLVTITIAGVTLFAIARLTNKLIAHSISGSRAFDPTQKLLFQKLAGIAVVVIAFFVGIDLLSIDLTSLAIFSGAFGLAVGFGLQKTIGNLIAGIILLMDRSIKPGDVIVVGQSFGWVNKIGVRAVSVITRDGKEHLIPNENLMTQEVENWSFSDRDVRIRIPVTIAYSSDMALAQQLMMQAATDSPRVLKSPAPNVWMTAFAENGAAFEILVWINDPESGVGNVKSDVLNRLWRLFQDQGVEVPLPQRIVTMKPAPLDQPLRAGDAALP